MLYVAVPSICNYLEYGGHGVLVVDIDRGHRFVKQIEGDGILTDGRLSYQKTATRAGLFEDRCYANGGVGFAK